MAEKALGPSPSKPWSLTLPQVFRTIGFAEAVSFLILMGIAMPLKYALDLPLAVKYCGWAHGLLFIAYMALALLTARAYKWTFPRLCLAGVAALLPFGPFLFDRWALRVDRNSHSNRHV